MTQAFRRLALRAAHGTRVMAIGRTTTARSMRVMACLAIGRTTTARAEAAPTHSPAFVDVIKRQETALKKVWRLVVTTSRLWLLALPLVILVPLSWLNDEWGWRYALWATQQAGPTAVKLAQWASSREDRFPVKFCERFGRLRDHARPHAWRQTVAALAEALGSDWSRKLSVEVVPVGSGCVAQVHRGEVLVDTLDSTKGDRVAVKVVHPQARARVEADLALLRHAAQCIEWLFPKTRWLSLVDAVDEFAKNLAPQMDMRREANNLERLGRNFAAVNSVSFPRPRPSLTTQDVLVEDFVEGAPITDFVAAPVELRQKLSRLGVDAVCKMIFHDNFLHGDLHPGNIVVVDSILPSVCFLDAGIVVELNRDQHAHFVDVLAAFMRHDGERAGRLMIEHQAKHADTTAQDAFCAMLRSITDKTADEAFFDKVGDYASRIFTSAADSHIKLQGYFVSTAIAIRVMEGVANALDKDVKIGRLAMPWILSAPRKHE